MIRTDNDLNDELQQNRQLGQQMLDRFSFHSTKTYMHNVGLSATFRQWRADSHCKYLHGYALQIKLTFQAVDGLDVRNWVVDFGSLKSLKHKLEDTFDHKTLVAADDPLKAEFLHMEEVGLIQLVIVPSTGCEMFAALVYELAEGWLRDAGYTPRVRLQRVEVSEHGGNSGYVELPSPGNGDGK